MGRKLFALILVAVLTTACGAIATPTPQYQPGPFQPGTSLNCTVK